jgi:hypothetical protein
MYEQGTLVKIYDFPRIGEIWFGTVMNSKGGFGNVQYTVFPYFMGGFYLVKYDRLVLAKESEFKKFEDLRKTEEILNG